MLLFPTVTYWKLLRKTCHCTLPILFCSASCSGRASSQNTKPHQQQHQELQISSPGTGAALPRHHAESFHGKPALGSAQGEEQTSSRANQHSEVHMNPSALLGAHIVITGTEKDVIGSKETGSRNLHKTGLRSKIMCQHSHANKMIPP